MSSPINEAIEELTKVYSLDELTMTVLFKKACENVFRLENASDTQKVLKAGKRKVFLNHRSVNLVSDELKHLVLKHKSEAKEIYQGVLKEKTHGGWVVDLGFSLAFIPFSRMRKEDKKIFEVGGVMGFTIYSVHKETIILNRLSIKLILYQARHCIQSVNVASVKPVFGRKIIFFTNGEPLKNEIEKLKVMFSEKIVIKNCTVA